MEHKTRRISFTFKSMSESTMIGDFPPSSKTTGVRCFAAAVKTIRPTFEFPAKEYYAFTIVAGDYIQE